MTWTCEYDNDVGPGDGGYYEWWYLLRDGERVGRVDNEEVAAEICAAMNERQP